MVANHSCKAFEERVLGHGSLAWLGGHNHAHWLVPNTPDTCDMRFAAPQGFNTADDFFNCLRDAFDVLYAEGDDTLTMLFVCLHCRLIGRPGASGRCSTTSTASRPTTASGSPGAWTSPATGSNTTP